MSNNYVKQSKVVDRLPITLEANAIYYVKVREGFDMYVTDMSGQAATPLNTQLSGEYYSAVTNEESFGASKGSPVYTTGTGYKLAQANNVNCKKIIGLVAFDTEPGQVGLVQKNGVMIFNNTQWAVVAGFSGGIANINYWLDSTKLGKISNSSPSESSSPAWSLKLGCGINNTSFSIQIQPSVKL